MQINSEDSYRQALAEIQRLTDAPRDSAAERQRLELQAAAAAYAERLHNGPDARKGKPQGSVI